MPRPGGARGGRWKDLHSGDRASTRNHAEALAAGGAEILRKGRDVPGAATPIPAATRRAVPEDIGPACVTWRGWSLGPRQRGPGSIAVPSKKDGLKHHGRRASDLLVHSPGTCCAAGAGHDAGTEQILKQLENPKGHPRIQVTRTEGAGWRCGQAGWLRGGRADGGAAERPSWKGGRPACRRWRRKSTCSRRGRASPKLGRPGRRRSGLSTGEVADTEPG